MYFFKDIHFVGHFAATSLLPVMAAHIPPLNISYTHDSGEKNFTMPAPNRNSELQKRIHNYIIN